MKIESLRIENFRCFADETIWLDNYSCLIGANGCGKSTVLTALNIFFRQIKDSKTDLNKLSKEDFHHKNTAQPIRITVTFTDLSKQASKDLADYERLGKLTVSAVAKFDDESNCAEVKQFGSRLGIEEFRDYFGSGKKQGFGGGSQGDFRKVTIEIYGSRQGDKQTGYGNRSSKI